MRTPPSGPAVKYILIIFLLEQQPPQGVFVCDHAGRVISEFSLLERVYGVLI